MIEGVVLIDKPKGISSFSVVKKVRAISKVKRVGHAGTLDPLASGLLIVCLGRYTKLAGYLGNYDKVYESTFKLGENSTTDDAEGKITKFGNAAAINREQIEKVKESFVGEIEQRPSRFSAIKINGKKAYELARSNQDFEIMPRKVRIFDYKILSLNNLFLTVLVHCSSGTYIRSLARDLGKNLLVGCHATMIRRIRIGQYLIENAIPFKDLDYDVLSKNLLVDKSAVLGAQTVQLRTEEKDKIKKGQLKILDHEITHDFALACLNEKIIAIVHRKGKKSVVVRVM